MKRVITFVLCLAMLASLLVIPAAAAGSKPAYKCDCGGSKAYAGTQTVNMGKDPSRPAGANILYCVRELYSCWNCGATDYYVVRTYYG